MQRDLGYSLAYGDAIALYTCMTGDTSTYTASSALHMPMPIDAVGVMTAARYEARAMLGDLDSKQKQDNTSKKRAHTVRNMVKPAYSSYFAGT